MEIIMKDDHQVMLRISQGIPFYYPQSSLGDRTYIAILVDDEVAYFRDVRNNKILHNNQLLTAMVKATIDSHKSKLT